MNYFMNAVEFAVNGTADYVIGGAIIAIIAIVMIVAAVNIYKNNNAKRLEEKSREVDDVVVKHGVRFTPKATIVDQQGNDTVSYIKNDIIIKPRKSIKVGKHSEVRPGKWTILASDEGTTAFNVRIGNYVKEYKHGQEIILADGDEICPTSTTIILR